MKKTPKNKGDGVSMRIEQLEMEASLLRGAYFQLKKLTAKHKKAEQALRERVKELSIIYEASRIMEGTSELEKALGEVVKKISPAYRFPELACARIVYNGKEYKTKNFKKTKWRQFVNLKIAGKKLGLVEVFYLKKKPFIIEEKRMIKEVASQIGNIAERKKAEGALRASEQKYRGIFKGANDLIQRTNPDGVIIEVNDKWLKTLGYSKKVIGKIKLKQVIHPDYWDFCSKKFKEVISGRSVMNVEAAFTTRAGKKIPVEVNAAPLFDEKGNFISTLGIFRDISQRKEVEEDLREGEERYRNLIEGSYDMIQSVAPDGRFRFVNKAWHDTLGYTKKELSKLTMFDIIHPDSLKHCQEAFQQIMGGKSLKNIEAKFITKDRRSIFVEGNAFPRYKGDKIISTQGFFRDVTELRKAREKAIHAALLERQLEQQREIDKMKTEFISIVSHQLRTPLSVIRGNLEMVLDGTFGKITGEQSETLDQAHLGTKRLIRLVNDLLNLSRLEAGRLKIEPEPTQFGDFIRQILSENEQLIKEGRCEVIVKEPKPRLPKVSIDLALLRQVVNNLLANAIHYSGKDRCDVCITIEKRAKDYLVSIADRGVGIPKDAQSRIFTKFFRAENARRIKVEGSGLGLSIVKMLVEAWGGKIWFESEEGKGATFYFTIPRGGMKEKKGEKALAEDSM